jgi:hypothetical protein
LGELSRDFRDQVYLGRRKARRVAAQSLRRELRAVGYNEGITWSGPDSADSDMRDSVGDGRGYLVIVAKRYQKNIADGVLSEAAMEMAIQESHRRLKVATQTAVLAAFASERSLVQAQIDPTAGLIQRWNVSWCKGTCLHCAELSGETQAIGWSFPAGRPPLHPNCGCYIELVPISWAWRLAA